MTIENFLQEIGKQYQLDPNGPHGLSHWGRVLENGIRVADKVDADKEVISLFSIFHDACRLNDGFDPGHGSRAASLAKEILGSSENALLTETQIDLLLYACQYHADGLTEADVTIQACWDADRLDLARVSIQPTPKYLCTEFAKDSEIIWWASDRARRRHVPAFVENEWFPWFDGKR